MRVPHTRTHAPNACTRMQAKYACVHSCASARGCCCAPARPLPWPTTMLQRWSTITQSGFACAWLAFASPAGAVAVLLGARRRPTQRKRAERPLLPCAPPPSADRRRGRGRRRWALAAEAQGAGHRRVRARLVCKEICAVVTVRVCMHLCARMCAHVRMRARCLGSSGRLQQPVLSWASDAQPWLCVLRRVCACKRMRVLTHTLTYTYTHGRKRAQMRSTLHTHSR